MPFSGSTFTNVNGATTAVPGQIIQSAVWNNIHSDYATAFNQLMGQLIGVQSNRNILWMNGGLEIWQRGAGASASIVVGSTSTAYTADRWYITTGANQSHTIAAIAGLSNRSQLAARIRRDAAQVGVTAMVFGHPLDTDELFRLRGNKVALSALLSAGVNWSPTNGTLVVSLYVGTGAVGKRGGGFAGETQVITISTNLTPGGAAVAISGQSSGTVPTNATQGELQFSWTPVGAAGAADDFTIDDIELESITSSLTWVPFIYDRLDFSTMLLGCKRHYTKTHPYEVNPTYGAGLANSLSFLSQATARISLFWQLTQEMRANPSFTKYHPTTATSSNWFDFTGGVSVLASIDITNNSNATKGILIYGATAAAIDRFIYIHMAADAGI